jgi:predicted NBD/HSP70 family sugar kinase
MSYVLFDIGGTSTRVAVTEDLKTFSDPIKFNTPADFDEGVKLIVAAVKKLAPGEIGLINRL